VNNEELIRKLNSVGKAIFTEYYSIFQSYGKGNISKENCIELLVSNKVSNDSGAAIRCSNAKLILQSNMECMALKIITESKRLPINTIKTAKQLMNDECSN